MAFDIHDLDAVVQAAVDRCNNKVKVYSTEEADQLIKEALIVANNGKTYLDPRDIRDRKCGALFTIMERVIKRVVVEGLAGDEYFNKLVETLVVGEGEQPRFKIEDADWLTVSEVAPGTQAVRRQRITGVTYETIPTTWKVIKTYEELNRVLAGQANLADAMRTVANSFRQKILSDVYGVWANLVAADFGGNTYVVNGAWDEEDMIELIDHVEAKSGQKATIYATRAGARKLATGVVADSAKEDMYNMGYYGKFNGTPIAIVPQRHTIGTDTFMFDDSVIHVLAGPAKPIKMVLEGDPLVNIDNAFDNQDLTQNYTYLQKYGIGFILSNGAIGRYTIA